VTEPAPPPECHHAAMTKTDDAWVCPCGLTIERQPTREDYLAAARAHLKPKDPTTKGPR